MRWSISQLFPICVRFLLERDNLCIHLAKRGTKCWVWALCHMQTSTCVCSRRSCGMWSCSPRSQVKASSAPLQAVPSSKLPGGDRRAGRLADRGEQLEEAADTKEHTQRWQTLFAEVPNHFCRRFQLRHRVAKPRSLIITFCAEERLEWMTIQPGVLSLSFHRAGLLAYTHY